MHEQDAALMAPALLAPDNTIATTGTIIATFTSFEDAAYAAQCMNDTAVTAEVLGQVASTIESWITDGGKPSLMELYVLLGLINSAPERFVVKAGTPFGPDVERLVERVRLAVSVMPALETSR
jgi:hypothetical protein